MPPRNSGTWTEKEDERLTKAVAKIDADTEENRGKTSLWKKIAEEVGGSRTAGACRGRWHRGISPSMYRGE